MKLEHEDPRVIDYVLGELPEDERAEVRAALAEAENADAAAFARELGGLSNFSRDVMAEEAKAKSMAMPKGTAFFKHRPERGRRVNMATLPGLFVQVASVLAVILVVLGIGFSALPRVGQRATLNNGIMAQQPKLIQAEHVGRRADELNDLASATITRGAAVGGGVVAPAPAAAPAPPVAGVPAQQDFYGHDMLDTNVPTRNLESSVASDGIAESEQGEKDIATSINDKMWAYGQNATVKPSIILENSPEPTAESKEVSQMIQETLPKKEEKRPELTPELQRQLGALGYISDENGDGISDDYRNREAQRPALQLTLPITFKSVLAEPLSTFAADVDTASYTLARREIQGGRLPDSGRVRTEEFINYFDYGYAEPTGEHPFSVTVDIAGCPWAQEHRLARVGIRGKAMDAQERVAANLVFLVDVSGSMNSPDKLPLVRESLRGLLETLKESDRVALVTYAGESRVVLPPTSCEQKDVIRAAIDSLGAGGSTNGAGGIVAAYDLAQKAFIAKGINRVMIATDGDFNVGVTSQSDLERLITERAKTGVFLSVLGYGTGNLNDGTLETLADKGNGFYAYIDDIGEARRVLVEKGLSAIATIAKDVKFQIEFNPAKVGYYRQIGYENRQLAAQDFNDDTKDAGDIGPGHTVTALYELVPAGQSPTPGVDALKYQQTEPAPVENNSPESMTVKLRYKQPEAQVSQLLQVPVTDAGATFDAAPADFRFASAVAAFAQVLKGLQLAQPPTLEQIRTIADSTKGNDPARQEFVDLVVTTKTMVR